MNARLLIKQMMIALGFMSLFLVSFAQKTQFVNVENLSVRNTGTVLENNEIKGYYTFYKLEKVDKKSYSYLLQVQDADLNEAFNVKLIRSRYSVLAEVVYNGNAFALLFYDRDERTFELTTLDKRGNEIGKKVFEKLESKDVSLFNSYGFLSDEGAGDNQAIFPVGSKGFLRYSIRFYKGTKFGYKVEYFSNDLDESKSWHVGTDEATGLREFALISSVSEDYATLNVVKREGLYSKDFKYYTLLLDLNQKRIAFEIPMARKKYNHSVAFCEFDAKTNSTIVMGSYFNPEDKTAKAKSLGLYTWKVNQSGEILKENYFSWEKDMAQFIPTDAKGRLDGGGYVYIHRAVRNAQGKLYIIGESYKKTVSGGGLALNALAMASGSSSSGVANFQIVLMDLVIFELDNDFNLKEIDVFEKNDRRVLLPAGYGNFGSTILGMIMKYHQGFDYSYTEMVENGEIFYLTYFTRIKEEGKGPKKSMFGTISCDDLGEFSEDKIDLETEASSIWVLQGKPGYVSIWEYFRKEERLEVRLEQINY
ncbi:MAG: DUF6770 family protein [Bacteroidota bacterium]